jgi:hypothetical protein
VRPLTIAILLTFSSLCHADIIVVARDGSGDYARIQPAIDAAEDGDTVLVKSGEYRIVEPIDLNRLRDPEDVFGPPPKNIVIRSEAGPEATTIRMVVGLTWPDIGRASELVFRNGESDASEVTGLTLTGGVAIEGGGVYCTNGSSPTLSDCTITGNVAMSGLWLQEDPCDPTNSDEAVGGAGGGVYCTGESSPTLTNCRPICIDIVIQTG